MEEVPPKKSVRCRPIALSDLGAVTDLLCEGFPRRSRTYWTGGLDRMAAREVPDGFPRFGYVLEVGGRIAGVILMIATQRTIGQDIVPCANVASWYVMPEYRAYAHLLASVALRSKETTYLNISAAPHTWSIVEQQGYTQYCNGLFFALAALAARVRGAVVSRVTGREDGPDVMALPCYPMLCRHVEYGCAVVVCRDGEILSPFVFQRYAVRSGRIRLPAVQALYAPSQAALVRYVGTLGRYFAKRGAPVIVMDADGPVAGLRGVFTDKRGRKYFKGPHRPGLGDLADTEFAIFGL